MSFANVPLNTVCEIDKTKKSAESLPYVGLEHIESATGKFIGSLDVFDVKSSTFKFSHDHVLYGRLRPYLNKALCPNFIGHCSSEIFPLRPTGELNRKYLFYWLVNPKTVKAIDRTSTGARMPRANMKAVMGFFIPLPPFEEQKRIVAILDKAFAGIDKAIANTEQNIQNAKELFESYLDRVIQNKRDDWTSALVGDVVELAQGLAINAKTKHLLVDESSKPLLRIKDLRNGTQEQFVAEEGFPPNAEVYPDDIIYTRTGQVGLVFMGRHGVLHNNSFKVSPVKSLNKRYMYWWLQGTDFKKNVVNLAQKAAQPDISHKLFKAQSIDVPPLEYQADAVLSIEAFFERVRAAEEKYSDKLKKLKVLKQSLLQKAFSGELISNLQEVA